MTGTENTRPHAGIFRSAAAGLACAFALSLAIGGGSAAIAPAPAAAQATCPAQPAGLAPEGPGPTRFTMMIRINQQNNVNAYTNFNAATGGLGGYVRPQDIFVINTRFETTTPTVAASSPPTCAPPSPATGSSASTAWAWTRPCRATPSRSPAIPRSSR